MFDMQTCLTSESSFLYIAADDFVGCHFCHIMVFIFFLEDINSKRELDYANIYVL